MASTRGFWRRLPGPTKVAIVCATVAIVLTVVGQLRNPDEMTARSLLMGILIGGGSWGLVSWAIAYAAWDVEAEIAAGEEDEAPQSADASDTEAPCGAGASEPSEQTSPSEASDDDTEPPKLE